MLRISTVSFPGFGIGEFNLNSVAFSIGKMEIAWYAIIIALGMVFAVSYTIYQAKKIGVTTDDILDYAIFTIPVGIIGARLYYVLSKPENFNSLAEVINIRNGGLAIYGGLLAGAATVFVVSVVKKIRFTAIGDCCMPGILMAQAIGRWGNFMNGEAFGYEYDGLFRMGLNNLLTGYKTVYVHPTFLYESLWNIIGFVLIVFVLKRFKSYDGEIILVTCAWYGLGRMFIEGLRTDSLYTSLGSLTFRTSQVLAGFILICSLALLIYFRIRKPKREIYHK